MANIDLSVDGLDGRVEGRHGLLPQFLEPFSAHFTAVVKGLLNLVKLLEQVVLGGHDALPCRQEL
jgi:hypothetical protein